MCVPKQTFFFGSHKGRDITARSIRQWRGLPLDENDDMGRPPFPDMSESPADEREFVQNWFDFYYTFAGGADPTCVVATLDGWPTTGY